MSATPARVKIDHPFAADAEVLDMVARFERCAWPYARWTHRAHLAVALVYLHSRALPFDEALARVRHHIPLYNRACGTPDGYHDTLTVLFVRRVAAWLAVSPTPGPSGISIAGAVEELAAAFPMAWVLGYYSPARLWSAAARDGWVEPDLRALDF